MGRMSMGLVAALMVLVAGCAKELPVMTPGEYWSKCVLGPAPLTGEDICDERPICDAYREVVSDFYENLDACRAACEQNFDRMYAGQVMNGCFSWLVDARDLCIQFCRRKFERCDCDKVREPGEFTPKAK